MTPHRLQSIRRFHRLLREAHPPLTPLEHDVAVRMFGELLEEVGNR